MTVPVGGAPPRARSSTCRAAMAGRECARAAGVSRSSGLACMASHMVRERQPSSLRGEDSITPPCSAGLRLAVSSGLLSCTVGAPLAACASGGTGREFITRCTDMASPGTFSAADTEDCTAALLSSHGTAV